MNKKILLMVGVVIVMGIIVFALFAGGAYGEAVLKSDIYPYQIQAVSGSDVQAYDCESSECRFKLLVGQYDFFMDKEGYYSIQESVSLVKGAEEVVEVIFQEIPEFAETELVTATVDEAVFDTCYGDWDECGYGDLYSMEEDSATGYMTLWEGEIRRATFTKGMEDSKLFVAENGVSVWDTDSGEAYFVNFLEDSREYLFTAGGVEKVMFVDGGYVVEGDSLYWMKGEEFLALPVGLEMSRLAYFDGKIYFLAEAGELTEGASGAVVAVYDGVEVYVIIEGLDIEVGSAEMASDEEGVYVRSGESSWKLIN